MVLRGIKNIKFKTYEPEKKLGISKEEVLPTAIHYSTKLGSMWSGFQLFFSGFLLAIRAFFKTKEKFQDFQMKNAKILDLRRFKDRPKQKLSFK